MLGTFSVIIKVLKYNMKLIFEFFSFQKFPAIQYILHTLYSSTCLASSLSLSDITAAVSCFLTSTLMPILASYSDYVTVMYYLVFLYTCSLSLAAAAFLAFSAGVSVHTDRSPSSVCVERNFLGPAPNPVASINYTLKLIL